MAYKIVFFDIDGTLVDEEKQIPGDAAKAIRELQEKGIVTAIATGRAPYFFQPIAAEVGIASYISLNGAYVVHDGAPIYKHTIPRTALETLVGLAATHGHPLVFQGSEGYFANADAHPHVIESISSLKVELPGFNPSFWETDEIFQAFLHCEEHEEHLYGELLNELRLVRWHQKAMDVLPNGGSKARGIEQLLKHLGIAPEEAVAFGDGLNDKEMLSFVGLGIAMGNAHEQLKPYADYVTARVDEGGIVSGLRYAGLI
ncbi:MULTISPECIES: Cof-type HAD-IIB family hydrolase [Cohnella]|uniref:Cof-type HAD-IIB family hydrolase n=1 Tax=Cohnella TaxID=329857 RepID=UPI00037F68C3|nr:MULTISPECIES: Cof-type HAD-IIB family hydrolase [Cohnella]REK65731.1 MAG: Cof-type HAD-IIB family hydrolase [Cohnella sp.]